MQDKRPETRYEFKLNFKEITLFIVGSIGVISLFFIIGIWIGKNLNAVPSEMINEEYLTTQDFPNDDEDVEKETEIDISSKDDASFEFQGTLNGEGITPIKEKKIKVVKDDDKKKVIEEKKEIDKFSTSEVPSDEEKKITVTKAKKEVSEKQDKKGRYTVQIASLKSDKAAIKLMNKLEKKGYDAYFIATNIKDKGVWYRVRVGNYLTKDDADEVVAKLEKTMKMKGMVVRDTRN